MMRKLIVTITLLTCILLSTRAQEEFFKAPDLARIERNIKDASSSYYYPNLLKKYLAGDPKMTREEGRCLYFGYIFQADYQPADTSIYNYKLAETLS